MSKLINWYSTFSDKDKLWHVVAILSMFIFPSFWLMILAGAASMSLGLTVIWLLRKI